MSPSRALPVVLAVFVAVGALVFFGNAYSTSSDWAAVVNGHEIGEDGFLRELEAIRENETVMQAVQLPATSEGAVPSDLAAGWLTRRIQDELVEREIDRRGAEVTNAHTDQARQLVVQQFGGAPAWEAFDRWFQDRQIAAAARLLALQSAIAGTPSEAELREEYESDPQAFREACVSHILVETEQEAQQIAQQLGQGGEFAELAREHSADPTSSEGGDLGCSPRGSYVEPFDSQAFELPVGEVSEPVQTQFGWHLILVRSRERQTFEEARAQLEQRGEGEAQQELAQVMGQVLSEAEIEVNPKYGVFTPDSQTGQVVSPPEAPQPPQGRPGPETSEPSAPELFPQPPP